MNNFKNKNNVVTCLHCAHHEFKYASEKICFPESNEGACKIKNIKRLGTDTICSDFKIKSGLFTAKWYPGKE